MFPRRLVYHSGRRFMMQKKRSKLLGAFLVAGLFGIASVAPAGAQNKSPEAGAMPKVGDVAPDFTLKYFDGSDLKDVSLNQYRGKKNVVLAFYIFAFTGG
jgi:cytochrome oxidase Cu insertion factor (SCO1/SenC/PrrC family)